MNMSSVLFANLAAIALSGCTVVPQVEYRLIKNPSDMEGMTDSFYRHKSMVSFEKSAAPSRTAASAPASADWLVVSKPAGHNDNKIGIRAITNWRSSTMVNLTKKTNTDLIDTIGVEVTDKTASAINQYGGVLLKVLGIVALNDDSTGGTAPKPCDASIIANLKPWDSSTLSMALGGQEVVNLATGCVTIKVEPVSADAMPFANLPVGLSTSSFYYSACRDAEVAVKLGEQTVSTRVRIADPRFIQLVQYPAKGSIKMHSECGVSVVTDATPKDNTAEVLGATSDLVKAVLQALEKK